MPAKVIGSFDELKEKRYAEYDLIGDKYGDPECMWKRFYEVKENNGNRE